MKDLILHLVPAPLHPRIQGISAADLRAFCRDFAVTLQPDHREFLAFAGATDPEVFSDVYDFRPGELGASPFVPVYKGFLCVAYKPYPDSDSLYVDLATPSAGLYGLLDEQLHMKSRAEILAAPPSFTCFGSAFAESLYINAFDRGEAPAISFGRQGRRDVGEAVAIAGRLGMRTLLANRDVAVFTRDGVTVLANLYIPSGLLGCRFGGGEPHERGRLFQIFEDNIR